MSALVFVKLLNPFFRLKMTANIFYHLIGAAVEFIVAANQEVK